MYTFDFINFQQQNIDNYYNFTWSFYGHDFTVKTVVSMDSEPIKAFMPATPSKVVIKHCVKNILTSAAFLYILN